jgi:hypothetical protein
MLGHKIEDEENIAQNTYPSNRDKIHYVPQNIHQGHEVEERGYPEKSPYIERSYIYAGLFKI